MSGIFCYFGECVCVSILNKYMYDMYKRIIKYLREIWRNNLMEVYHDERQKNRYLVKQTKIFTVMTVFNFAPPFKCLEH